MPEFEIAFALVSNRWACIEGMMKNDIFFRLFRLYTPCDKTERERERK